MKPLTETAGSCSSKRNSTIDNWQGGMLGAGAVVPCMGFGGEANESDDLAAGFSGTVAEKDDV